jgi:hypothetical protein
MSDPQQVRRSGGSEPQAAPSADPVGRARMGLLVARRCSCCGERFELHGGEGAARDFARHPRRLSYTRCAWCFIRACQAGACRYRP